MKSQRWSRLVSVLVFAVVLTAGGGARAQWGFLATSGCASVDQFGSGYGAFPGGPSVGYGPCGGGDCFGPSNFIGFPAPGYAASIGQRPLTANSVQTVSAAVTLLPGWSGSTHRIHRTNWVHSSVPRLAGRR